MQITKGTIATTTINRTIAHVVSASSSVALLMILETQAETIRLVRVLLAQQLADQTIAMGASGIEHLGTTRKVMSPTRRSETLAIHTICLTVRLRQQVTT